ncbi:MAG: peroxiredoxin family protein [Acidobacteria bacterium]|nr:peroxiredoxin family protein [Acidobacteriota bacterium]
MQTKSALGELQANYPNIQSLGAEMIALSADTPDTARMTVSELGITYPVLSDASLTYIRQYDVLHPQEGIARPSMFIVDREGVIRWRFVGMSASARPPIETVLEELRKVQ